MKKSGDQPPQTASFDPFAAWREQMVVEQIARRGVRDTRILRAMSRLPRHRFVEDSLQLAAYEDRPLSIGFGQTISQPFMVAKVTELAAPGPTDRALEIGAGCGYQTALLSELCAEVYAVEVIPQLARQAMLILDELDCDNVTMDSFDGSGGWARHAPFDVIIVSAGAPQIPALLLSQLADGGRLVIPVGAGDHQELTCIRHKGDEYETVKDTRCRYVDLVGRYGVGTTPPQA